MTNKQTKKTARYIVDNSFSCLSGHLASGLYQLRKQSPEINFKSRQCLGLIYIFRLKIGYFKDNVLSYSSALEISKPDCTVMMD